jgi:hypothetical protein
MLGLNPLRAANKGKLVAVVPPVATDEVLAATQSIHPGEEAVIIVGMTEKGGGKIDYEDISWIVLRGQSTRRRLPTKDLLRCTKDLSHKRCLISP